MAKSLNVNGAAKISVGGSELGYSVDGVKITINQYEQPVHVDLFGPLIDYDTQYMGGDATITAELIYWDDAILQKSLMSLPGVTVTNGTLGAVGALYQANSIGNTLAIAQQGTGINGTNHTWTFGSTRLVSSSTINVGVIISRYVLTWKASAAQGTGSSGAVLFVLS